MEKSLRLKASKVILSKKKVRTNASVIPNDSGAMGRPWFFWAVNLKQGPICQGSLVFEMSLWENKKKIFKEN